MFFLLKVWRALPEVIAFLRVVWPLFQRYGTFIIKYAQEIEAKQELTSKEKFGLLLKALRNKAEEDIQEALRQKQARLIRELHKVLCLFIPMDKQPYSEIVHQGINFLVAVGKLLLREGAKAE